MDIYSYTRLDTFKQCPRKYSFQYIEKPEIEKRPTIEAHLGTVCHETVQQIYKDLNLSKRMTLEETLALYEACWEREKPPALRIVNDRYTEENYRETGRGYVQAFYEKNAPFDDGKTVGIEKQVQIRFGGKIQMTGYIDRLVDHGNGNYEIIDYKTNRDLPSVLDLEANWQLPLYHVGLLQMFPDLKEVTCTWYFLAHGKAVSIRRTKEDLVKLEHDVLELVQKIEAATEFETRASALCSWCDFEAICPARAHLVAVENLTPEELSQEDGVRLVDEYLAAKQVIAEQQAKLSVLEQRIYQYAMRNKFKVVRGSQDRLTVWGKKDAAQIRTKDNPLAMKAIVDILKKYNLWERFASVSTFSLAKAVDNRELPPQVIKELTPFVTREEVWRLYPSKLRSWG